MKESLRKTVLCISWLVAFSTLSAKEQDTVLVSNLLSEIYLYNQNSTSYLPLVDVESFAGNVVHFELNKKRHKGLFLKVGSAGSISIFLKDKLISHITGGAYVLWCTDSLFVGGEQVLHYSIYSPGLSISNLELKLLTTKNNDKDELLGENNVVVISQRISNKQFHNFLILGLLVVMVIIATIYNYYPRVTKDFFRFSRAIAIREMDENLLKSRPFMRINVLFYVFYSIAAGYVLVLIYYLASFEGLSNFNSLWSGLWFWLKVSSSILAWLVIKYLIVRNFTTLFNVKSFLASHYFNYIRIGLFIFIVAFIFVTCSFLGFEVNSPTYYNVLFNALLIAVCIRTMFIMLKLMNSAAYKFLHLFSYLCGTELIPLGIILFLGFNQSF